MGQLDEAGTDSKKAFELSPDVWSSHIFLSLIFAENSLDGERRRKWLPAQPFTDT